MTSLVSARNVSKRFGKLHTVDDASFDIEKGLIGPNGVGKATLLKAMLGLTAREACQFWISVRSENVGNSCITSALSLTLRYLSALALGTKNPRRMDRLLYYGWLR